MLLGILGKFLKCLTRITVKSFIVRREPDGDSTAEVFLRKRRLGRERQQKKEREGGKKKRRLMMC